MVKTLLPALLLTSLVSMAQSPAAVACDCVTVPITKREQFGRRDIVFLGKVTAFQSLQYVEFQVLEKFSGQIERRVRISAGRSDCDYFLPPITVAADAEFLIYATRLDDQTLVVSRCSGSGPAARRSLELARLRQLTRHP